MTKPPKLPSLQQRREKLLRGVEANPSIPPRTNAPARRPGRFGKVTLSFNRRPKTESTKQENQIKEQNQDLKLSVSDLRAQVPQQFRMYGIRTQSAPKEGVKKEVKPLKQIKGTGLEAQLQQLLKEKEMLEESAWIHKFNGMNSNDAQIVQREERLLTQENFKLTELLKKLNQLSSKFVERFINGKIGQFLERTLEEAMKKKKARSLSSKTYKQLLVQTASAKTLLNVLEEQWRYLEKRTQQVSDPLYIYSLEKESEELSKEITNLKKQIRMIRLSQRAIEREIENTIQEAGGMEKYYVKSLENKIHSLSHQLLYTREKINKVEKQIQRSSVVKTKRSQQFTASLDRNKKLKVISGHYGVKLSPIKKRQLSSSPLKQINKAYSPQASQAKEKRYSMLKKKLQVMERSVRSAKQMKERMLINSRSVKNADQEKLYLLRERITEREQQLEEQKSEIASLEQQLSLWVRERQRQSTEESKQSDSLEQRIEYQVIKPTEPSVSLQQRPEVQDIGPGDLHLKTSVQPLLRFETKMSNISRRLQLSSRRSLEGFVHALNIEMQNQQTNKSTIQQDSFSLEFDPKIDSKTPLHASHLKQSSLALNPKKKAKRILKKI